MRLPRRTMTDSESLSFTASTTSVMLVTGCPFMLTITSWSLNPELGGGRKDQEGLRVLPHPQPECSICLLGRYYFAGSKHISQETRNSLHPFKYEVCFKICYEITWRTQCIYLYKINTLSESCKKFTPPIYWIWFGVRSLAFNFY